MVVRHRLGAVRLDRPASFLPQTSLDYALQRIAMATRITRGRGRKQTIPVIQRRRRRRQVPELSTRGWIMGLRNLRSIQPHTDQRGVGAGLPPLRFRSIVLRSGCLSGETGRTVDGYFATLPEKYSDASVFRLDRRDSKTLLAFVHRPRNQRHPGAHDAVGVDAVKSG